MTTPLKIGLSARIYHPQAGADGLQSKTLQYLEQSVAHWVMSRDVMVLMIPTVLGDGMINRSSIRLADYARYLDGLVLQGGADLSPRSYGEDGTATRCATPTRWSCSTSSSRPASRCWASAAARS